MMRSVCRQLGGDLHHVAPLKARTGKLVVAWLARAVTGRVVEAPYGDPPVTSPTPN